MKGFAPGLAWPGLPGLSGSLGNSGLTAQEAQTAIEGYEAAASKTRSATALDAIEARFNAADESGRLADRVREVVLGNRAKAAGLKKAA